MTAQQVKKISITICGIPRYIPFVDAEIKYFSEYDPVVYNTRRAVFRPEQVGQVWWNTSSIRYYWYEQGTNKSRWLNWGKSAPEVVLHYLNG